MAVAVMMVAVVVTVVGVIMAVIVMPVVVGGMIMVMVVPAMSIGAAFRLKRALDLQHPGAESGEHFGDDMVAPDPQPCPPDLGLEMTVAEMPGKAHEMGGIAALDLEG